MLLTMAVVAMSVIFLILTRKTQLEKDFANLKCPENNPTETEQEQVVDLSTFMAFYLKQNPNITLEEIKAYRYQFLISHNCKQTLENMSQNIN